MVFVFLSFSLKAQNQIGLKTNLTRFDQYLVVDYNKDFENRFNAGVELGIGLNTALFGSSIRPILGLYSSFELIEKEKFTFQPTIAVYGHFLQMQNQRLNFTDVNLGYTMENGRKWKFYHQIMCGYGVQWLKENESIYLNVNVNLGVRYVL